MFIIKKVLCIALCLAFTSTGYGIIYSKTAATKNVYANLNTIAFDKAANKLNLGLNSKPSMVKYFGLDSGKKVVLDLYNCKNNIKDRKMSLNNKNVLDIRNSQFSDNPTIARVVVDLNKKIDYKLINNGNKITLAFADNSQKPNNGDKPKPTNTPKVTPSVAPSITPSAVPSITPSAMPSITPGTVPSVTPEISPNIPDNNTNIENQVTYLRTAKSIIHITNMKSLKYNLDNKTVSFQLDISYDLSALEGVSDDYIQGIEVISSTTFSTVIITMKDAYQPLVETNGDGIDLIISKPTPQPTTSPSSTKQRIVVLDPGHGGKETGAAEEGKKDGDPTRLLEKNLNLDISLRVKALLEAQNIKVYMTRTTDQYFDKKAKTVTEELTARAQYANSLKADFFVSIHTNSAAQSASGAETLYYPTDGPYKKTLKKGKLNSIDFAQIVQNELIKVTGAKDRKIVSRPNLIVLKYNQVVPILVEVGFLSNPKELANLKTEAYKQKIAKGISNGIIKAYAKN